MTAGQEILGYTVIATLGFGARSTIFAVRDDQGQVYALKQVLRKTARDQRFLDQAILEHDIAIKFDHPALRKSYKLFKERAVIRVSEVYVLMEMVDGLTMEQHQPEDMISLCKLMTEVASGLLAMHKGGYVHADIKPNNILVTDDEHVKIIDFGQSCPIGTVKQRIQGTPDYIAPEQVLRQKITPQTDVFNLGATMYWLLTSRHVPTLIPKGHGGLRLTSADACPPPRDVNPSVAPALSNLAMSCVVNDPRQRPDMQTVIDRLGIAVTQIERDAKSVPPASGNGKDGAKEGARSAPTPMPRRDKVK